mmetsp:Transcript_126286/g.404252  ORF Transcript_126286/g.404252 Transcript_126286/m.404252 type:complete len:286 (-) Transcript_126286:286-1143(-)
MTSTLPPRGRRAPKSLQDQRAQGPPVEPQGVRNDDVLKVTPHELAERSPFFNLLMDQLPQLCQRVEPQDVRISFHVREGIPKRKLAARVSIQVDIRIPERPRACVAPHALGEAVSLPAKRPAVMQAVPVLRVKLTPHSVHVPQHAERPRRRGGGDRHTHGVEVPKLDLRDFLRHVQSHGAARLLLPGGPGGPISRGRQTSVRERLHPMQRDVGLCQVCQQTSNYDSRRQTPERTAHHQQFRSRRRLVHGARPHRAAQRGNPLYDDAALPKYLQRDVLHVRAENVG